MGGISGVWISESQKFNYLQNIISAYSQISFKCKYQSNLIIWWSHGDSSEVNNDQSKKEATRSR